MTAEKTSESGKRRLWGRAKGRPLSPYQQSLVDELYPDVDIDGDPLRSGGAFSRVCLEVGFGGAEHLLHQAAANPNDLHLGVEPFLNGVAKALTGIKKDELSNIRLHHGDARDILDLLPNNSIDRIDLLYPDPWPKVRHFKRRLVQEEFIAELARVLKPGGEWRFASDIISYVDWALVRVLRTGLFEWNAEKAADWATPYKGWPGTRYEAKAYREGRTPHYFTFIKA